MLANFQPTRYAHSWFVGYQHLMFQFAAFEKHTFPVCGRNVLAATALVNTQFTTIVFLPV